MKKKRGIGLILLALTLFLAACGSGSVSKKGINEISHKDLLKQLDNNETFWLITLDADPKLVKDSSILEEYEKEINKKGIEGAAYLNTYDLTEEEKEKLSTDYSDVQMNGEWSILDGGLTYVNHGSVYQPNNGESFDPMFFEGDDINFDKEIKETLSALLEELDYLNIKYEK